MPKLGLKQPNTFVREMARFEGSFASVVYCVLVGLYVVIFLLYLATVLFGKKRPRDVEGYATMMSFTLVMPTVVMQPLPPAILPLLSLFLKAYLHKAR